MTSSIEGWPGRLGTLTLNYFKNFCLFQKLYRTLPHSVSHPISRYLEAGLKYKKLLRTTVFNPLVGV